MTKASEVTVTDAEVEAFVNCVYPSCASEAFPRAVKKALAAFLAARVPDAKPNSGISLHVGFNACRDAVLRGPG